MLIRHCGCTTQVITGCGMPGSLKGTVIVGDLLQPIPSVWHNCTFRHAHQVPVRLSPKLKSSFLMLQAHAQGTKIALEILYPYCFILDIWHKADAKFLVTYVSGSLRAEKHFLSSDISESCMELDKHSPSFKKAWGKCKHSFGVTYTALTGEDLRHPSAHL